MKKHNEGYALVLVLVVLVVLSLLSATVLSASLKDLQAQQKAAQRMADSYKAEGEIEKIIAQMVQEGEFPLEDTQYVAVDLISEDNSADPEVRLIAHINSVRVTYILRLEGARKVDHEDIIKNIEGVTRIDYESSTVLEEGDSD